jgi:hypothetical protein
MYEYIGILLGARPILDISRIKVNTNANKEETFVQNNECLTSVNLINNECPNPEKNNSVLFNQQYSLIQGYAEQYQRS